MAALTAALMLTGISSAQMGSGSGEQPFIGFQSLDGTRQPIESRSSLNQSGRIGVVDATRSFATASGARREAVSAASSTAVANRYPYPAGGSVGYRSGTPNAQSTRSQYAGRYQAPTQSRVSSQMNRSETMTGSLNHRGQATASLSTSARPAPYSAPAQLYRNNLATTGRLSASPVRRETSTRLRTAQLPQSLRRGNDEPTLAEARHPNTSTVAGPTDRSARLHELVVQQVSSTVRSNRTSVARIPATVGRQTAARPAQSCVCVPNPCVPNPNAGLAYRQPNPVQAANVAPSLNGATGATGYQPGYAFQQGLGVPQFRSTGNVLTPFFRGSGVYTPLLPLQSMPAGTYLGQGIIGQPTAYVDGQPIRNLLRYISP